MSGDVRRSVRRSSVPPLDGPSSCTSSDSQRLPTLKSPSDARLLDWRLKDHLHTVQVYFQAPFRKFSGMGSPFPCMVCRGSHWKALKNATDLLPKTAGGGWQKSSLPDLPMPGMKKSRHIAARAVHGHKTFRLKIPASLLTGNRRT